MSKMNVTYEDFLSSIDVCDKFVSSLKGKLKIYQRLKAAQTSVIETNISARLLLVLSNVQAWAFFGKDELEDITVYDLSKLKYRDLIKWRNMGKRTINELSDLLEKYGLNLKY